MKYNFAIWYWEKMKYLIERDGATMTQTSCWITNTRLETGFHYENELVIGTKTELHHLKIENGKIKEIVKGGYPVEEEQAALPMVDADGLLLLPSFRDMHIHLDKTYYGGPWKAPVPATKGIVSRLEEEQVLLPLQLPVAEERATKLLELLIGNGSVHIRSHCNVDPIIGLQNLEATLRAVERYKAKAAVEIVAFPQHGLLRSNAAQLVREALRNGASIVGGVDPASLDQNVEKSLHTIMEIAVEANAPIDLHIHDSGYLGLHTFKRLAELTAEAGWQGKVTISHALAFAGVNTNEAAEVAMMLAEQQIDITSALSLRSTIPFPLLKENGVQISLGDDSIMDHWSPFGKGDSLEKAGLLAQRFGWSDERALGQTLSYITGGVTPLNEAGDQCWPRVGDEASFVFAEASCSAEAVARRSTREAVMYKGNIVAGSLKEGD